MKTLLKTILDRYTRETPDWFKNIGYAALAIAAICGTLLNAEVPLPEVMILKLPLSAWLDKIGMAASAVALVAFGAKKDIKKENQNP